MARIIDTRKAASEIYDIIKNARNTLTLVSPYLKLTKDFKQLLELRDRNNKKTKIIYRTDELSFEDREFLHNLMNVSLMVNEDLHAKCYVNDDKAIITSLNLYDFSMANNKELGVLIDCNEGDKQLYFDTVKEVDLIEATSKNVFRETKSNKRWQQNANTFSKTTIQYQTNNKNTNFRTHYGYCIRTGVEIPFNPERPLS